MDGGSHLIRNPTRRVPPAGPRDKGSRSGGKVQTNSPHSCLFATSRYSNPRHQPRGGCAAVDAKIVIAVRTVMFWGGSAPARDGASWSPYGGPLSPAIRADARAEPRRPGGAQPSQVPSDDACNSRLIVAAALPDVSPAVTARRSDGRRNCSNNAG